MNGHWSEQAIEFIRKVIPEIADVPLYVLRNDESAVDWSPEWMACFCPLADLQAQTAIERLGLWRGRGICIRVRDDFETWSPRCKAGTLLHEMAHGLEYLSQDDARCPMADLSPIARELLNGCESEILQEAGIVRNELIAEQHGQTFIRIAMHLYWRARQQVVIAASDIQIMHSIYSLPPERYNDAEEALSSELAMSRNLNLTRLRESPSAFTELFA